MGFESGPWLVLCACCPPWAPSLLPLGPGCTHPLQASLGACAEQAESRWLPCCPSLCTSPLWAPTSGPVAPPRAEPFSRRSKK